MRAQTKSLVYRGANGGVAGEDTRVISTNSDRKVSILSINNYEID